METANIIEVKDLNFKYGQKTVLESVSFEVKEGDYLGVVGPNGGGKSTLLRLILGLAKPCSGQVKIFGRSVGELRGEKSRIGYVPQRLNQLQGSFPATVLEVVKSGGGSSKEVARAMSLTKVEDLQNQLIGDLSGGQLQRVMIARALCGSPKILILDEPTSSIDVTSEEQFYTLLCDLNTRLKITIILVSHDIDVIVKEARSLLLLNKKLVVGGPAAGLINEYYLQELYGGSFKFLKHIH